MLNSSERGRNRNGLGTRGQQVIPLLHPVTSAWEQGQGRRGFPDLVAVGLPSPSPCGALSSLCLFVIPWELVLCQPLSSSVVPQWPPHRSHQGPCPPAGPPKPCFTNGNSTHSETYYTCWVLFTRMSYFGHPHKPGIPLVCPFYR